MVMQRTRSGKVGTAESRAAAKKSKASSRRRKGGWRTSKSLPWSEVKAINALAHAARYNTILHIMPTSGTDAERKRHIARIIAHLGQHLKRHEAQHVGTTIYEKAPGIDLHGHHLCRVDVENLNYLAKYDGRVVRVEKIARGRLSERVAYCTKQRAPLAPAFEEKVKVTHPRQKGSPIAGPRLTHTKAARQIQLDLEHERVLARERAAASFQSPAMVAEITKTKAIALAGQQLELFPHTPPARLSEFHGGVMPNSVGQVIEFRRRQRGLTQRQLGRIAGISQPTLANALAGRFRLSEWATNRIREALTA